MSEVTAEQMARVEVQISNLAEGQQRHSVATEKMAIAVQALVEHQARREERDEQQAKINSSVDGRLKTLEDDVTDIKLARAEERPARLVLNRYWWVLIVAGIALSGAIVVATKELF